MPTISHDTLPLEALRELRASGGSLAERNRAAVLLALASGASKAATARILGLSPAMVFATIRRFRAGGIEGLHDGRLRPIHRIERRAEIVAMLPAIVAKQPQDFGWSRSTWTIEVVALEVERQTGVRVSRSHMARLLAEAGCRRVRPKPTVALAPEDQIKQIRKLRRALSKIGPRDVVVYEDEVDIHLNPKVGPDWAPSGTRKTVVTPGQNKKSYIAGSLNPVTKTLITVSGERKNSDLFIELLKKVARAYRPLGTVHMVVDNYVIHHSKKTQKAVHALGGKIVLHYLPPYSPDFNPIERVWWDLHAAVTRNHRHPDLPSLLAAVDRYLTHYDKNGGAYAGRTRLAA